jgi:predicted transcriptional regulator
MPIHIGKLVQAEVENQRLTHKEFGARINKDEKTVPDIYKRSTMAIDLLVKISEALKKDFLHVYYEEEPMKSLRDDIVTRQHTELQRLAKENEQLRSQLELSQKLNKSNESLLEHLTKRINELEKKPGNDVAG